MAKNRCPICGAAHKDPPHQCRLCGAVMDGTTDAMSGLAVKARPMVEKKKGTGGVMMFGVITVAVIAVGAIAFGFTSGDLSVGAIRNKIPFLRSTDDGWVKVDDPEGGFTVQLPSSRQTVTQSFPLVENSRMSGWNATIGTETSLFVAYGKLNALPDETAQGQLNRVVDTDLATTIADSEAKGHSASVGKRDDTNFRGYPAIVYDIKGTDVNGEYGYQKSVVFLKGSVLYVISINTIYKDFPQWDRLTSGFQFTA